MEASRGGAAAGAWTFGDFAGRLPDLIVVFMALTVLPSFRELVPAAKSANPDLRIDKKLIRLTRQRTLLTTKLDASNPKPFKHTRQKG